MPIGACKFIRVVIEPGMADIEHKADVVVYELGQEVRLPNSYSGPSGTIMDPTCPCRYVPAYYL